MSDSTLEPCPTCKGTRELFAPLAHVEGQGCGPMMLPCPDCDATGTVAAGYAERAKAGRAAKAARGERCETLGQAARRFGLSVSFYSRIERGVAPAPTVEILGPSGAVHYRRPLTHPDVDEAIRTTGYSVRLEAVEA